MKSRQTTGLVDKHLMLCKLTNIVAQIFELQLCTLRRRMLFSVAFLPNQSRRFPTVASIRHDLGPAVPFGFGEVCLFCDMIPGVDSLVTPEDAFFAYFDASSTEPRADVPVGGLRPLRSPTPLPRIQNGAFRIVVRWGIPCNVHAAPMNQT
jgi:hypothetical protein